MELATHPMTESDPLYRYRRRTDIILRQVGMDLCLYDPTTDQLHILNPVAAAIWQHITPDRSIDSIIHGLALSFETDSHHMANVRLDVLATVNEFKTKKLILREDEQIPRPTPATHPSPTTVTIPDPAISSKAGAGYHSPLVKTLTESDLKTIFHLHPPLQGVMRTFGDTFLIRPEPVKG
jgi:hypothetical protein